MDFSPVGISQVESERKVNVRN